MAKPQAEPPAAPDYSSAAQVAAQGDLEAARIQTKANRPTQLNPFGRVDWEQDPNDQDLWTQTTTMNPDLEDAILSQSAVTRGVSDSATNLLGDIDAVTASDIDLSGVPDLADPGFGAVEDIRSAMMQRMQPDFDYRRDRENAQLVAQGFKEGDEAYDQRMRQLDDAENRASLDALLRATGESDRIYARTADARQRGVQEAAFLRSLPMNELNAVLRGQSVGLPQFQGYNTQAQTAGADVLGATQAQYDAELGRYNAQQAAATNRLNAYGNIIGGAAGFFA